MGHLDLILRLAPGEMRYNCLITSKHRLHLRRRTPTSRLTHRLEMEEATMPNVPHPSNAPQPRHEQPCGLTLAELEAELAEALPERAAMSALSVMPLDAASGTVEAVGDGVSGTAVATIESPAVPAEPTEAAVATTTAAEPTDAAPVPTTTAPEPSNVQPVASTAAPEPSTTAPEPSTTAPEPTATAVEPSDAEPMATATAAEPSDAEPMAAAPAAAPAEPVAAESPPEHPCARHPADKPGHHPWAAQD